MKRTKMWITALTMAFFLTAFFAACGSTQASTPPTADQALAQGAQQLSENDWTAAAESYRQALAMQPGSEAAARGLIEALAQNGQDVAELAQAYEALYACGSFEKADYEALAALYGKLGETVKCRNMLEMRYRLAPDSETLEQLETTATQVQQDSEAVQQMVRELQMSLAAGEDQSVIETLASQAWADTMTPQLRMGCHRYTNAPESETSLRIETGRDGEGDAYTKLWYCENGMARYYAVTATQALAAQMQQASGTYTGAFSCVSCDTVSGTIYMDAGTLADGHFTGNYTSAVGKGDAGMALPELFAQAAQTEKVEYAGSFSAAGVTQEKQQASVTGASGVVYAYNAKQTDFLYMDFAEGTTAEVAVFDSTLFGVPVFPEW